MFKADTIFLEDKVHRYVLTREWDLDKPSIMFIALNPSIGRTKKLTTPTIRRCIGFARQWGFGKLFVANLFSFRATFPKDLFNSHNPVGNKNDYWLKKLAKDVDKIVLAYGNRGKFKNRHDEILKIIDDPYCIKKLKTGMPPHPLYLKYTKKPVKY